MPKRKRCDGSFPPDCVDLSDEMNCSETSHFYCENNVPLFVPREKVLDGKQDCSDNSDECPRDIFENTALSSREELIRWTFLRVVIWLMAFLSLSGNLTVMVLTVANLVREMKLPPQRRSNVRLVNSTLIVNLALADFIMGLVLLTIGAKTVQFSGSYCQADKMWRTSALCGCIGVMTVVSSEASVLTLVCITSYRIYCLYKPIASRSLRVRLLVLWISMIWAVSLTLALIPLAEQLAPYMISKLRISSSPYFSTDLITLAELQRFALRVSCLANKPVMLENNWHEIENYLERHFHEIAPAAQGHFGYYSDNGVCMPKLYRVSDDDGGFNVMSSAIITFNFVALLYIAAAYVAIYRHTMRQTQHGISSEEQQRHRSAAMYRKISVLIGTDMCCWFPVCIMTFLSMGGQVLDPMAYAVSAVVLLPINSSLNPIIYATPFAWVKKLVQQCFAAIVDCLRRVFTWKTSTMQDSSSNPQSTML